MSSHPLLPPLPPISSSSSSSTKPHFLLPSPLETSAHFTAHPALSTALKVTVQSAGVGTLISAVQNALDKHDKGAMGIFTRTGGTISFFAGMGFTYAFTQAVTANIRETDDALNSAMGGCAAGFFAGARRGSLPVAFASCAAIATLLGTFDAAGKSLTGTDRLSIPRPEREQRRLEFFKKPKERVGVEDAVPA